MLLPLGIAFLAHATAKNPFFVAPASRLLEFPFGSGKTDVPTNEVQPRMPSVVVRDCSAEVVKYVPEFSSKKKSTKRKTALTWEDKFAILRAFKKIHGHCNVPKDYAVGGFKLGGWVATQRKEYKKHRFGIPSFVINDKRIMRLDRAGFDWYMESEKKLSWSDKSMENAALGFAM